MRRHALSLSLAAGLLSGCVSTTTVTRYPDGREETVTVTQLDGATVGAVTSAAITYAAEKQEQRAPQARVIAEK